ncbi:MAG: rubrerythrin family protein, partial [Desulfurococcales archaeon]|nr:rubrerythrin family protein [Desulfurococcales archaeon]
MTRDALMPAFGGESMAHMRHLIFADIAEKEGFRNVARLFRAVAYAERIHAGNHFRRLKDLKTDAKVVAGGGFGSGDTLKNLELAITGERFEVKEMYPAYIEISKAQGD